MRAGYSFACAFICASSERREMFFLLLLFRGAGRKAALFTEGQMLTNGAAVYEPLEFLLTACFIS